jgi:cytochrome b subunit of formate dehydrogenase
MAKEPEEKQKPKEAVVAEEAKVAEAASDKSPTEEKTAAAAAKPKPARPAKPAKGKAKRFNLFHRVSHAAVTLATILASTSGFPLKFKDAPGMQWLTDMQGGVATMAIVHRVCAVVIFVYLTGQFFYILYYFYARARGVDTSSIAWVLPRKRETLDVKANLMYMLGRAKEPSFKKQVYWGFFDWVVSLAMFLAILVSGAVIWFPEFFANYIPGTWFNVAYVTHSNGAVLLVVITLVTHFYNIYWSTGHLSDCMIIFTGTMTNRRAKLE